MKEARRHAAQEAVTQDSSGMESQMMDQTLAEKSGSASLLYSAAMERVSHDEGAAHTQAVQAANESDKKGGQIVQHKVCCALLDACYLTG